MINGIIIINKEKDYTSHDVVAILRKLLKIKKVGHTGTLDPNATGVLPILLGQGTKLSKYLINHDKTYEAVLKLGEKRSTGDSEGDIIETKPINVDELNKENIEKVLKTFLGKQIQTPPIYSAIKLKGKKLYEYAREGVDVEIPKRNIEIYNIELLTYNEDEIQFKVDCSKGTYIRTLCEDIATKLNTVGYMKDLKRTKVGIFNIENSIKISELEKNITDNINDVNTQDSINRHIIKFEDMFSNKDSIILNDRKVDLFLNGVKLTNVNVDEIYKVYDENSKFIGIGTVKNNLLKRDIII